MALLGTGERSFQVSGAAKSLVRGTKRGGTHPRVTMAIVVNIDGESLRRFDKEDCS